MPLNGSLLINGTKVADASTDLVLPQIFTLPSDVDEDDWIEFGLMGAYTQASLTPFNGFWRRDQYWVDEVYTGKDLQPAE